MALPIAIRTITVGTFTPPKPVTTIYGSSAPGLPEMTPGGTADMSRAYNNGQVGSNIAGQPTCLSASSNISLSGLAAATSSSAAACQTMINYFSPNGNLRDDADHLFTPLHEPDNNNGISITQFAQAHANFAKFCWPTIKKAYTHNVTWGPIFTGAFFGGGTDVNGNARTDAYRDSWLAGYTPDWIGSDPYANLTLIPDTATYAQSRSYAWMIGEFGTQATNGGTATDAQHKAHMVSAVTSNSGLVNPCFAFLYWASGEQVMWARLVNATVAGATSITTSRASGAGTIGPGQIIIDPHGTHPETVTTIGSVTTTDPLGNGQATFTVPALAFPHAANTVVWLYPQAIQYWRSIS